MHVQLLSFSSSCAARRATRSACLQEAQKKYDCLIIAFRDTLKHGKRGDREEEEKGEDNSSIQRGSTFTIIADHAAETVHVLGAELGILGLQLRDLHAEEVTRLFPRRDLHPGHASVGQGHPGLRAYRGERAGHHQAHLLVGFDGGDGGGGDAWEDMRSIGIGRRR